MKPPKLIGYNATELRSHCYAILSVICISLCYIMRGSPLLHAQTCASHPTNRRERKNKRRNEFQTQMRIYLNGKTLFLQAENCNVNGAKFQLIHFNAFVCCLQTVICTRRQIIKRNLVASVYLFIFVVFSFLFLSLSRSLSRFSFQSLPFHLECESN